MEFLDQFFWKNWLKKIHIQKKKNKKKNKKKKKTKKKKKKKKNSMQRIKG